jgi:hypothetical protein
MSDDVPDSIDQLILIVGFSSTGKSASLRNIRNQERWMYLGTEAGKRLPFKNRFDAYRITDPSQVMDGFDHAANNQADYDGIVVDSMTFLMDMLETMYVINAANTQAAWGYFAQYFKQLMQSKVALFGKPVIITAHVKEELDPATATMKTKVPIKGSLKNNGVEAYFSTVVVAKRMTLKQLEGYESNLLIITDEERDLGYKHVFQTRPTKETTGESIRSPMGMFSKAQTYMDNDAQMLLDHVTTYYAE